MSMANPGLISKRDCLSGFLRFTNDRIRFSPWRGHVLEEAGDAQAASPAVHMADPRALTWALPGLCTLAFEDTGLV